VTTAGDEQLEIAPVTERVVRRASYDQLMAFNASVPSGVPVFYYLENNKIMFSPEPAVDCTVYITGYYAQTAFSDLDDAGTNAWTTNAPMLLAAQASLGIAQQLGMADTNPQYVAALKEMLATEKAAVMGATALRRGA
jgi:hypothetical protein